MRLVLREFISMLKESGELDALVVDLLFAMGIQPTSKPQTGARQYGVDIAGVGPDDGNNGVATLFLVTVKRGDIGRSDWDGTPQAVRPSLTEIMDVYIPNHIEQQHKGLPIKIIVCCGGDLKQDVQQNWAGFTKQHREPGRVDFELWGGDKLSLLLEQHLLNEHVFDEQDKKCMRKALALVDLNEYDLQDYFNLLERSLSSVEMSSDGSALEKKQVRMLRSIHLALHILFHWAKEADNLRQAYFAAERTVFRVWDWLRKNSHLSTSEPAWGEFLKIHETFGLVADAFYRKVRTHCFVQDGLCGYGADEIEYPLRTFELIGLLGVWGMRHVSLPVGSRYSQLQKDACDVANTLVSLIKNNPSALCPSYDGHAIDIGIALLLLSHVDRRQEAAEWIEQLIRRVFFAYRKGRGFPVCSDSYDDLLDFESGEPKPKEQLMEISTLLPMLAEWCAVLELPELYLEMATATKQFLSGTTLQLWYPDADCEEYIWRTNAALEAGTTEAPIELPQNLDDLKERMVRVRNSVFSPEDMSFFQNGFSFLALLASRHFRTPLIPYYWQRLANA